MIDLRKQERAIVINPRIQDLADKYKLNIVEVYSAVKRINFDAFYLCIHTIDRFNAVGFSVVDGPGILRLMQADEDCAIVTDMPFITPKDAFIWLKKNVKPQDIFESKSEDDMVDLRKKEAFGDKHCFIIYKGSTPKDAAKALKLKSAFKHGDYYWFSAHSDKEAKAVIADANDRKKKGYDFDGSFSVKTFSDTEWEIYRKNGRTVKFESTNEKAFDPEKEYLRTIDRYNAARAGKDVPGMTRGDQIDYLLSTWNYSDEEYDAVWAEFQKRCPNWLKRPRKENIEYIEKEIDMIDLREKKVDEKFDGDDIFDYIENNGKSFKNDDAIADAITNKFNVSVSVAKKAVKAFHNGEVLGDDDLKESCAKTEAEDEIKFVNKGEKFKSEKGDDVEIIAVDKKDDKTEVTYKLGDEEKKGDIKDVIKMLNGAEYKAVDDKKDEKKSCESEEDDAEETPDEKTPDEEEPAEEKKTKKESVEDDSVEVTLTEDFHVPGTDIILEAGDVIRIIPRKDD